MTSDSPCDGLRGYRPKQEAPTEAMGTDRHRPPFLVSAAPPTGPNSAGGL